MNYIKKLQAKVNQHEVSKEIAEKNLSELRKYLLSEKFRCGDSLDGYVNVQDVLNWVDRIRGNLSAGGYEVE